VGYISIKLKKNVEKKLKLVEKKYNKSNDQIQKGNKIKRLL
jgi:hypothetical protein